MERENAQPGYRLTDDETAAGKPEEVEFLRLDEDGKHACPVRIRIASQPAGPGTPNPVHIRVVSQPAGPGTPNPVMIQVRYASESEVKIMNEAAGWPTEKVVDELALIGERAYRVNELACIGAAAGNGGIFAATGKDEDEVLGILRNISGALQVLVTYLGEQ